MYIIHVSAFLLFQLLVLLQTNGQFYGSQIIHYVPLQAATNAKVCANIYNDTRAIIINFINGNMRRKENHI